VSFQRLVLAATAAAIAVLGPTAAPSAWAQDKPAKAAPAQPGSVAASIDWQNRVGNTDGRYLSRTILGLNIPFLAWGTKTAKSAELGLYCLGAAYFAEGIAEAYCGPALTDGNWSFSLGGGFETSELAYPYRVGASVAYASGAYAAFGLVEYGGTGEYHLVKLSYTPVEYDGILTVGLMSQRYDGEGIYFAIGSPLKLYGAILFDIEKRIRNGSLSNVQCLAGLVGLTYNR
jgi:hypothetical protein